MNNLYLDTNGMWCYNITKNDIKIAEEEYKKEFSESNLLNSKTVYNRKESRIAGILGEIVFKKMYPEAVKQKKDITYDFDYNQHKVDVKCKIRKVKPSMFFEASFFLYQASDAFNADIYYFMSTTKTYEKLWICGWDFKKTIMEHPNMKIWKAGMVDENNGMSFQKDTVCLKYQYLKQPSF